MPLPTDYHDSVRDAVATVFQAALVSAGVSAVTLPVQSVDDLEHAPLTMPVVAVCCVGPEQSRPEFGSNIQSGVGYPVLVAYMTGGIPNGEQSPGGLPTMTQFRRIVHTTFHDKRLSGVAQVGRCEVSDSGPIFDRDSPVFGKVQSAVVVTAVGRFPRS